MSDSRSSAPVLPRPCPICGRPSRPADHPFCSQRCADVDLYRWLKGSYAIPAAPEAEDDEALDPDAVERSEDHR